ncbi:MAG: RnfABCDGE type electron transport complex subunit D [Candidatus Riflebacteria bacterium]|nr:RnfABCDGE type electron transport complex subunit D [Candidatus Riflebacteria bacterium]
MNKPEKIRTNSQFGAAGYCLLVFLFIIYAKSVALFGLKFAAGAALSWVTGGLIWFIRILFQRGEDQDGVDKPFGWLLFLLFPLFIPLALPLWLIPFILVVCYLITVAAFGGHGHHIFNPVIVAVVFMAYGYSDSGLIEASRPFPPTEKGYLIWTAGIPPRADIRDIYGSIPTELAFTSSLKGLIPSMPGSCFGSAIFIASLILAVAFNKRFVWWFTAVTAICFFGWLLPQPAPFNIPFINLLFMGIMPSLLLCGTADFITLPESVAGQCINALVFSVFAVFILLNSSNILAPAYGFLISQVVSPLIIDVCGVKHE